MRRHAFTLIELSMALVVIGFIIAGVLTGSSLIKQAQLRKVTNELLRYETAFSAFQTQYNQLPGDFSLASTYWSGIGNGDGNGIILQSTGTSVNEDLLAWQHLSQAGLIEGARSGSVASGYTTDALLRSMIPASARAGTYYLIYTPSDLYGLRRDAITAGSVTSQRVWGSAFTVEEAYLIDKKIDDAIPNTGKILAGAGSDASGGSTGTACTNQDWTAVQTTPGTYAVSSAQKVCRVSMALSNPK